MSLTSRLRNIVFMLMSYMIICMACKDDIAEPDVPEFVKAGGETTVFTSGPDAFTFPLANLDEAGIARHFIADGIFGQQFVTAPAAQFGGIGPLFNQNSCESCHVRNGRGTTPQFEGDPNSGLLLRISIPGVGPNGGVLSVPGFGGQLQNKAIFNTQAEGKMSKTEIEEIITYLDGQSVTLRKPVYTIISPYISLPDEILISPRVAPPVHGLGLLEAIPDNALLQYADEFDADGDGISGKPNLVWDILANDVRIGRFGWKAEQPTTAQQAADAAVHDMGLTNFYFPEEHCEGQNNCHNGLQDEVDVDVETTDLFAFYFQTLAVPAPRNYDDTDVVKGKAIFQSLQCGSCHVPKHITAVSTISALIGQTIYPYTDLLLHDMGEGLSDHRAVFHADGNEWRTPPLWGIGLTHIVNPKATFLHDGRAKTIEEAILWHGGEAHQSKENFMQLPFSERQALIRFIESL